MLKIFMEYAARQLKVKEYSINDTLDPNVTAYVLKLLNATCGDEQNEKENFISSEKVSRAEKLVETIKTLPKSSVNIYEAKMRIEKNTPFRRHYSISTIVNKNNVSRAIKREQAPNILNSKVKIQKLSSQAMKCESFEYEVEALDECSFIQKDNWKQSARSWNENSAESSSDSVIAVSNDESYTLVEVSDEHSQASSNNIKVHKVEVKSGETFESSRSSVAEDHSVLNVPSIGDSFDILRAQSTPQPAPNLLHDTFSGRPSNSVVPKRLVYEAEDSCQEAPPKWFADFMTKHNEDIKRIDAKLEKINCTLTKILAGEKISPKKVLISPRVVQIKRAW
jgi:hypothetical protein